MQIRLQHKMSIEHIRMVIFIQNFITMLIFTS